VAIDNKLKLLFGLAVAFVYANVCQAKQDKPNILMIYADDLAPVLGAYGHPTVKSPNIDALANEGIVFEEMHSNATICSASRNSILTGIRPSTSGLYGLNHDFKAALPDNVSLPRHFSNNGYFTQAMGKVADSRGGDWSDQWEKFQYSYDIPASLPVRALTALKNESRPWLLAVGFGEPHCPWSPSAKSKALYDIDEIVPQGPGRTLSKDYQRICYSAKRSPLPKTISDEQAKDMTLRYYASVTDLDRKVGKVIQAVKELGFFDNTIIVFWSGDHGLHLGENGLWGKWKAYRADSWVPMIMRVPGRGVAGTRAKGLVETVDMYPTLVDLAGLPQPASELEGYSFAPLLDVPDQPWKKAAFTVDSRNNTRSVKTLRYDYIVDKAGDKKELYDMIADPKETTNIAMARPDIVNAMEKLMNDGWRAALPENPMSGQQTVSKE
jgi:iduronate 2-sulfatase